MLEALFTAALLSIVKPHPGRSSQRPLRVAVAVATERGHAELVLLVLTLRGDQLPWIVYFASALPFTRIWLSEPTHPAAADQLEVRE